MSFFEKMMRVHTQLPSHSASNHPSPARSNRSSSLESVPDQPVVPHPRIAKPPVLMQHKMMDRAKMFSDLMNRKREFEMKHLAASKRVVCSNTKTDSLRLEQSGKIERSNQYEQSRYQQSHFERSMGQRGREDPLTRQLVGRLLTMLEQERSHSIVQHPASVQVLQPQAQAQPQQHQQPIVINNILRSPVESLSKDLIEKQMKIRILEQQRRDRHNRSRSRQPTMRSPRNSSHRSINTLELSAQSNMSLPLSSSSSIHQKQAIQIISDKTRKVEVQDEKNLPSEIQKEVNIKMIKEDEFQSTNFNSEQASHVREIGPLQRNRKSPIASPSPSPNPSSHETVSSDEPIFKPVRLEFNIESETSGMTLAEAFKKKIGRLKSQQNKQIKASPKKRKEIASNSQAQTINGTTTEISQNISINIDTYRQPLKKHSTKSTLKSFELKKQLHKSDDKKMQDKIVSGRVREPSNELMDRLISGQRAKMTKNEMLALTRKNYANLPEVQARKKQQEKRIAQQQRLAKAKEYQRSIRSNKSIKRDD